MQFTYTVTGKNRIFELACSDLNQYQPFFQSKILKHKEMDIGGRILHIAVLTKLGVSIAVFTKECCILSIICVVI